MNGSEHLPERTGGNYKTLIAEVRELFDEGWCVCRSSHLPGDLLEAVEALVVERDALRAQLDGMTEGSKRIAAERARSIEVEGYTPEHDAGHAGELALAAQSYALAAASDVGVLTFVGNDPDDPPFDWPWHPSYWKPTGDTVRDLEKAGGLIASAIDSILSVEVTD